MQISPSVTTTILGTIYIYLHMYVNIFAYSLDKRIIFLFLEKCSSKLPARQCLETLSLLHAHTNRKTSVLIARQTLCDSDFPCSRKPSWGRLLQCLVDLWACSAAGPHSLGIPFSKHFLFVFVVRIINLARQSLYHWATSPVLLWLLLVLKWSHWLTN